MPSCMSQINVPLGGTYSESHVHLPLAVLVFFKTFFSTDQPTQYFSRVDMRTIQLNSGALNCLISIYTHCLFDTKSFALLKCSTYFTKDLSYIFNQNSSDVVLNIYVFNIVVSRLLEK